MVGFLVLHDGPPCFDEWGSDLLPGKAGAAQRRGRRSERDNCLESQDQPLLPMARLNV
jgi:hypothetical protein